MSLGNFNFGTSVRLPLHLTHSGGIPLSEATNVRVEKIVKPDGTSDINYPKNMIVADRDFSLFYLDYRPSSVGSYLVIYSFKINGLKYSSMDSFIVSSSQSSSGSGYARPVQTPYARSIQFHQD